MRQFLLILFLTAGLSALPILASAQTDASPTEISLSQLHSMAESGDPYAEYALGTAYLTGNGVPQDYSEAANWFEKAAQNGSWDAQAALAGLKAEGFGTEQDYEAAFKLYQEAAENGHALSQHVLGTMIENSIGTKLAPAEAAIWYEKAALQGLVQSQTSLGVLYHQGQIVAEDFELAREWYLRAAQQGSPKAQNNLGILYTKGLGVEQDYEQAAKWYEMAVDAGFSQAMTNLGVLYENGFGVPQSDERAHELYRQAGEGSRLSRTTKGLPDQAAIRDYLNSSEFNLKALKQAAHSGDRSAQYVLGNMYLNGWRVPQDYVLAYKWINLTVTDPNSPVAELRDTLSKRMTGDQLNEAQRLSREWRSETDG